MRKLPHFLKNKNLIPQDIIQFPHHLLVTFPWGAKGFVYFVDPVNGNDNNNGFTLSRAKKTINAVLDSLPADLLGYEVRIFLHPGTYTNIDNRSVIYIKSINGYIRFHWLGTYANPDDPDFVNNSYSQWLLYLLDSARVRSNDQVVISAVDVHNVIGSCFSSDFALNYSTSVLFESNNFAKSWDSPSSQYAYRFKFISDSANTENIIYADKLRGFYFMNPVEIDPSNCLYMAVFFNSTQGRIDSIKFIPSSYSSFIQRTGNYAGFIVFGGNTTNQFILENVYYPSNAYHPSFQKESNPWNFTGCRQALTFQDGSSPIINIFNNVQFNQGILPDSNPPLIYLSSNAKPVINLNLSLFNLADNSIANHTIKNTNTNITSVFVGPGIKNVANNFLFNLSSSQPDSSYLNNKDIAFYLDEANNKLKLILKFSDGTVKTGEILLS